MNINWGWLLIGMLLGWLVLPSAVGLVLSVGKRGE